MGGNSINDQCFSVPGESDRVVCDASPIDTTVKPFMLKMNKRLPEPQNLMPAPKPWMVELAWGQNQIPGPIALPSTRTVCIASTGTVAVVDGEPVRYSCWQPGVEAKRHLGDSQYGLLGDFTPGAVWTVTAVKFKVEPNPAP